MYTVSLLGDGNSKTGSLSLTSVTRTMTSLVLPGNDDDAIKAGGVDRTETTK